MRQSLRDPASFETKTPFTESGRYLVNEIWRKTNSPEAYLIERELFVVQFQGLIVIHTADEVRIPSSGWQALYSIGLRIALHTAIDRYRSHVAQANNI